jgi:hypothetical protein
MRILIVEEGLKTGAGHWPVYIGGIASELRKAGDEVDVLVHRDATVRVLWVGLGIVGFLPAT